MFLGFPTYGAGPFERIGLHTSIPLLSTFVAVCAGEIALGTMIWKASPVALKLSHAMLPAELAFWVGFGLPFGPIFGLARTGILWAVHEQSR